MVHILNQFAKPNCVLGFDSYGWLGKPLPASADKAKFMYVLNSDAKSANTDYWLFHNRDLQLKAGKKYGLLRGVFHVWRADKDPIMQAVWLLKNLPLDVELPLGIDLEDKYAPVTLQTVEKMIEFVNYIYLLYPGRIDIYTANWWWDKWVVPFQNSAYVQGLELFWNLPLWNCDPYPPDSHLPGKWGRMEVLQDPIDTIMEGFNACVDVDNMGVEYWDEIIQVKESEQIARYREKLTRGVPLL